MLHMKNLAKTNLAMRGNAVRLHTGSAATLANDNAQQQLRQLQIDEAEAARKGGGQDEIVAGVPGVSADPTIESVPASSEPAAVANEQAQQQLRQLQIDEAEAARPGGGADEMKAGPNPNG
jgi:hypothetical protein